MPTAAFYAVSDSSYFLGAVGLINSLRLIGHLEPIYLLDCGLEEWQREAIEGEVTIVPDAG
jgi:3-mercaptopyruvate sulfurtransferase SseA